MEETVTGVEQFLLFCSFFSELFARFCLFVGVMGLRG